MREILGTIQSLLSACEGNYYDAYFIICKEYLKKASAPAEIIRTLLQFEKNPNNQKAIYENITKEEFDKIVQRYKPLIKDLIRLWEIENPTEDQFYSKVYSTIFNSALFPDDARSQAVFLSILSDAFPDIPYYRAENVLLMADNQYKEAVERLEKSLMKAIHMYFRPFQSKTEQASQLWKIASEIESTDDQIVYWSVVLNMKEDLKSDPSKD